MLGISGNLKLLVKDRAITKEDRPSRDSLPFMGCLAVVVVVC